MWKTADKRSELLKILDDLGSGIYIGALGSSLPAAATGAFRTSAAAREYYDKARKNKIKETLPESVARVKKIVDESKLPIAYQPSYYFEETRSFPTKALWNSFGRNRNMRMYTTAGTKRKDIKGGLMVGRGTPEAIIKYRLARLKNAIDSAEGKKSTHARWAAYGTAAALPALGVLVKDPTIRHLLVGGGATIGTLAELAHLKKEKQVAESVLNQMRAEGRTKGDVKRAKNMLDAAVLMHQRRLGITLPLIAGGTALLWRE